MSKHTPGPWAWSDDTRWLMSQTEGVQDEHRQVVRLHPHFCVLGADMRLIAAAPRLAEACEHALSGYASLLGEGEECSMTLGEIIVELHSVLESLKSREV